jgi:uncharacterized lipoprotein NlpE involved in copper resistance
MRTWRGGRPGQSLVLGRGRDAGRGRSHRRRPVGLLEEGGRRTAGSPDEGKSATVLQTLEGGGVEVLA